jgi:hypothetical protein
MTYIPASDASILAAIAEIPARAGALLDSLSGEPAKEIARVLLDPASPADDDVRTTADALRRWATSNRTQKRGLALA